MALPLDLARRIQSETPGRGVANRPGLTHGAYVQSPLPSIANERSNEAGARTTLRSTCISPPPVTISGRKMESCAPRNTKAIASWWSQAGQAGRS